MSVIYPINNAIIEIYKCELSKITAINIIFIAATPT